MMFKVKLSQNEQKYYIRDLFIFFILAIVPVLISFIKKLEISSSLPYLKQVDEFILLSMFVFIAKGFNRIIKYKYGFWFVFFFLLYIITSTLFAIIHSIEIKIIIYQGILDLKILFVFLLVMGLPNKLIFIQRFIQFGKIVLIISLPLIFIQIYMSSYYDILFPNGGHKGFFKSLSDKEMIRGAGVFWFVGELAFFSSFFVCYFFFEYMNKRKRIIKFWLLFSSMILILTLSRLEIIATILALIFVYTASHKYLSKKILLMMLSSIIIILGFLLLYPLIEASFKRLGVYDPAFSNASRVVFYYSSYILTLENFPFGTGLGTFGGQASAIFGSSLYDQLHFKQYLWYRESITMTDVFWPHVLVEAGFIGLCLYFAALLSLFKWLKNSFNHQIKLNRLHVFSQTALSIFFVMLINSMASANMNDFHALFITLLLFGVVCSTKSTINIKQI